VTATMSLGSTIRTRQSPFCPICGSRGNQIVSGARDALFGVCGEWSFSRCSNADCRLLWLDPQPLEESISEAYATYYTHGSPGGPRALTSRFLSGALRVLTRSVIRVSGLAKQSQDISDMHLTDLSPGRLLDIGCGDGHFLNRMKKRGWSVTGLDFDQQAVLAAKEKYGIEVSVCRLEGMECPDNSFDAVTMNHVIEHVFDPVATLREVSRILKPGGILVAVTPNADSWGLQVFGPDWRGLEPPRHIQIFSGPALEAAAHKAGLASVQVYSSSANAWTVFAASMQLTECKGATFGIPAKPPIRTVINALFMSYREARMNARTGRHGEENVLCARKTIVPS
jgi:SAM-dependent methyltransferase